MSNIRQDYGPYVIGSLLFSHQGQRIVMRIWKGAPDNLEWLSDQCLQNSPKISPKSYHQCRW